MLRFAGCKAGLLCLNLPLAVDLIEKYVRLVNSLLPNPFVVEAVQNTLLTLLVTPIKRQETNLTLCKVILAKKQVSQRKIMITVAQVVEAKVASLFPQLSKRTRKAWFCRLRKRKVSMS